MNESTPTETPPDDDQALPLLAPCRDLSPTAPWGWLRRGWADLKAAPAVSLSWGLIMVLISYLISLATWRWGNLGLYLGLVSGFVFVGPWLALTLYSVSLRLERGQPVSLLRCVSDAARAVGNALVFAVILTVVFLVWARAATMVHVFFPVVGEPGWREMLPFLAVGSAVGALFCAIIFAASAFSLPMLIDRKTDTVTAVVTSIHAVLRNKSTMLVWALIIGGCVVLGILTAWLAFAVVLPLLGHATWHAYRETIRPGQWSALELD